MTTVATDQWAEQLEDLLAERPTTAEQ